MNRLRAGVVVLAVTGESDGEHLTPRARPAQHHGRVLHRDTTAQIPVHPGHRAILFYHGALRDEVVDVARPVLNGGVPRVRAFLHKDLDHAGVQGPGAVLRCCATLNIMYIAAIISNYDCALELPQVLRVDAKICLQRDFHIHPLRHIDEAPSRPEGAVQRRKLVIADGHDGADVLAHQVRILADGGVHVHKDDAVLLPLRLERAVHGLRIHLRLHAGQVTALRLGNAQPLEGVLDGAGNFLPGARFALGGPHEVIEFLEIQEPQVCPPRRHGQLHESVQRFEAKIQHPLRLALDRRDFAHDVLA